MLYLEYCKIFCHDDGKTHTVSSRSLEPEDSEVLKASDLVKGSTLLWKVKGEKYTSTFLTVSGKLISNKHVSNLW